MSEKQPPCECGPVGMSRLFKSAEFRNGRATVREALALDLHAIGEIRAADREYDIAKQIREGKL